MQVGVSQFPLGEQPEPVLLTRAASVEVGTIQVGGDLVHLHNKEMKIQSLFSPDLLDQVHSSAEEQERTGWNPCKWHCISSKTCNRCYFNVLPPTILKTHMRVLKDNGSGGRYPLSININHVWLWFPCNGWRSDRLNDDDDDDKEEKGRPIVVVNVYWSTIRVKKCWVQRLAIWRTATWGRVFKTPEIHA